MIANPNAPTGLLLPVPEIEKILQANPDNIVVVDETYIEFAPAGASCLPLLERYDNLVITHTFSKTHNLAGARLGYCIARPELIADMNRVKFSYSPYNVNALTQAAGAAAIRDEAYFAKTRDALLKTRQQTAEKLRRRGFTMTDSHTNFLFATTDRMPCREIFEQLRQRGVLIRRFDAPRIENYLRITIGTDAEMARFFAALDEKSYEYGEHAGLGLIPGEVAPLAEDLQDPALKVPHIGWNALDIAPGHEDDPLFRYIRNGEYVYYVHSFYAKNCAASTLATSEYSLPVTGAVRRGLVYGTQFHPEKSGDTGLRLLKAFLEL